jgi:hypothetical protein
MCRIVIDGLCAIAMKPAQDSHMFIMIGFIARQPMFDCLDTLTL